MTRNQVIDLLSVITTFDHRFANGVPTDPEVTLWQAAVGDLDFEDARDAVIAHIRDSDEWLKPFHIRRRVVAMRGERLDRAPAGPPSEDLAVIDDPAAYLAALRAQTDRYASRNPGLRVIGSSR